MFSSASHTGYCPMINDTYTIDVEYASVSILGQSQTNYKKTGFECPNVDSCNHLDSYGQCPLFIEAPNHP
ncbi:hypothetical protein [Anaerovibrio lipolyticus]|uniref:hypothetical protein n=1 Tax=Anaerovibrio lipolyticus TaxID=82374 RepID=UPI0026EF2F00|nr:hypothetical protein [Anaerovibrio lipolyticus]MBE6105971.1 hypothetical protein [Anaerovibrio lipolyticus]